MRYTNADIVPAALAGRNATATATGSFSTEHYRPEFTRYGAPYVGLLPRRLAAILNERFAAGQVDQVIYSYSTPIAWHEHEHGIWIIPDVRYSATTSIKHQSQLYPLKGKRIPYDTPLDEYLRVVERKMEYWAGGTVPGAFANA